MTLEALLLLVTGFAGTLLITSNTTPYFSEGGALLHILLLPYVAWIIFVLIGVFRSKPERAQFLLVVVYSLSLLSFIFFRQEIARGPNHEPIGIHDGAVQTEVAGDLFVHGINPYEADYSQTAYAILTRPIPENPDTNVVWSHYIYPPLPFILQAAWQIIARPFQFFPDARIWGYIALFVIGWLLTIRIADYRRKTVIWLLTVGNPLVWLYVAAGANDILPAAGVVVAAWAIMGRRWRLAGLAFGLALAAKQSTWIILPLWTLWLWLLAQRGQTKALRIALPYSLGAAALVILPFVLWNPTAFYDDVVRYASGSILYAYPVSGTTFLQYLHVFGAINSPWVVFPTYWFQLLIGVPMMVALGFWLRKQPLASVWLTAATVLLLSVLLFSRYYNNNYTVMIILLAVAAFSLRSEQPHGESDT